MPELSETRFAKVDGIWRKILDEMFDVVYKYDSWYLVEYNGGEVWVDKDDVEDWELVTG